MAGTVTLVKATHQVPEAVLAELRIQARAYLGWSEAARASEAAGNYVEAYSFRSYAQHHRTQGRALAAKYQEANRG